MLARADVRLACFGLAGVGAVYLGFLGLSVMTAEAVVKRGGYYVMFVTFVLCGAVLWRWWRRRSAVREGLTGRQRWLVAGTIAGLSLLAINAEPYRSKILNDEFVLQSTAFNMHFFREVATMVRGYEVEGVFISTNNYLDKRPYFYPFVVSLAHDLTGYRPLNAYVVNSLLLPLALLLAFVVGRQLTGWRGGLLAVLLLGGLPLLGQNATGSGMELLNVVMILATLAIAGAYLARPSEEAVAALALTAVLLAQSRYESALYAAPVAVVVLLGWWRAQRVILPWAAIVAPLLLIPCALQNKVLSNSPLLWELKEETTTRFSLSYLQDNAISAAKFLFNTSPELANSLLLSVLGGLGMVWLAWRASRRRRGGQPWSGAQWALLCFSAAIVGNTVLVFCYYWSSFADRMASRFSLPLNLLLAFAAVLLVAGIERRGRALTWLCGAAACFVLGVTTTRYAFHYYSHLGIDEIEWERRLVRSLPAGERLIITNKSSLPWLLEERPAIMIDRAKLVADRLHYQLQRPRFHEILVIQSLRPASANGDHQLVPEELLPESFKLQLLAEKRFGTKIDRVSRLVAIDPAPKPPSAVSTKGAGSS
ncbi:glycosyltransferase family 39 protein [Horticoccus luteus]|uniref:Glycosyltransferase family 39 protein n=1 Tax=Horticoccus luteus TaxID=2862869 RepID=A0A8F9TVD6_9BACT|nr:glycosyltransferase family 39 protein [Horticoccus luteus]QYM78762.1 glycosyltransferase family 39 protein [Horticoccus luteus]